METRKHHFILTPILAAAGRFGGMLIPIVIAFVFGATQHTDAFFMAFAVVFFFLSLITQIFESLLLPFLAEHKLQDPSKIIPFLFKIVAAALPLLLAAGVLTWIFLPRALDHGSGFSPETAHETGSVFLWMLPFLLTAVFVSAMNGVLNSYKLFWLPAVSPGIRSVVVIAFIFVFYKTLGIYAIAAGFVAGELLRLVVSIVLILKMKLLHFEKKTSAVALKEFWHQTGYQVFALAAVQLIPLVSQWFATWFAAGDLSLYSYADKLYQIPYQIFLMGISQIFLSDWSDAYVRESLPDFRKRVIRDVGRSALIALVLSLIVWAVRMPSTRLLFDLFDFDSNKSVLIADLLGWLMLGFAPAVITSLLLRVLFVMKKSVHFLIQSCGRLLLQVVLILLLIPVFGIAGIAAATTLSTLLSAAWLFYLIRSLLEKEIPAHG